MHIIESGPAAGVVGAQALARAIGPADDHHLRHGRDDRQGRAGRGRPGDPRRRVRGRRRHHDRLAAADGRRLHAQGPGDRPGRGRGRRRLASSGSMRGGALQIGPRECRRPPGPVCYDRGGTSRPSPTPTSSSAISTRTIWSAARVKLNAGEGARGAAAGSPSPLGLEPARSGLRRAPDRRLQHDPGDPGGLERARARPARLRLFAFGGNGPLFAAGMARSARHRGGWSCRRRRACSPPSACSTPTSSTIIRAPSAGCCGRPIWRTLNEAWGRCSRAGAEPVRRPRASGGRPRSPQPRGLLPLPGPDLRADGAGAGWPARCRLVRATRGGIGREHERTYGHRAGPDEPVELVAIHVVGRGLRPGSGVAERVIPSRAEAAAPAPRRAYFGPGQGWIETPVLRRSELAAPRTGPLIVEEYDATCLVLPGWRASLDSAGNIALEQ